MLQIKNVRYWFTKSDKSENDRGKILSFNFLYSDFLQLITSFMLIQEYWDGYGATAILETLQTGIYATLMFFLTGIMA